METVKDKMIIRTTESAISDMIVQQFQGKPPIIFVSTKKSEMQKRGATIATLNVRRIFDDSNMVKKHRETKEANPYLAGQTAIETYRIQVILNCIWQNVLDNRTEKFGGDTGFEAQKDRTNGIQNYKDSRVICFKTKDNKTTFYVNYIVLQYLTNRELTDGTGNPIDPVFFDGYLKTPAAQKEKNRQAEADKHGLEPEFDPQIRQMKMSNIHSIEVFGYEYRPTEITTATVVNVQTAQTT